MDAGGLSPKEWRWITYALAWIVLLAGVFDAAANGVVAARTFADALLLFAVSAAFDWMAKREESGR